MNVSVGDHIIIRGHLVGDADREGVVVEVHGANGAPPYLMRWSDGHEALFFPGADATVEHLPAGESGPTT